jgi:hypothetical protein
MEKSDILRSIPKNSKRLGVITSGPFDEIQLEGYKLESKKEIGNLKFGWFITNH